MQALTDLILDANSLTGTIPETIGNLQALTYLSFNGNSLTGTTPETIGNLQALTILLILSSPRVSRALTMPGRGEASAELLKAKCRSEALSLFVLRRRTTMPPLKHLFRAMEKMSLNNWSRRSRCRRTVSW